MILKKIWTLLCLGLILTTQSAQQDEPSPHAIRYCEYCFTDLLGNRKSIIRPIHYWQNDITNGLAVDGSSLIGCQRITESDMVLMPDTQTPVYKVTWTNNEENATTMFRIMGNLQQDRTTPFEGDPRTLLKNELAYLKQEYGYEFLIGPELEFYVFDADKHEGLVTVDKGTYADSTSSMWVDTFKLKIMDVLLESGLNVEKIHHEVGKGQFEVSLKYADALVMADMLVNAMNILSVVAQQEGKIITFMPKPLAGKPGNGLHLNFSLRSLDDKKNVFYDEQKTYYLSEIGQSFIAGILKHVADFTILLNTGINSYKRLGGHEAPLYICCGPKNRSALIRLPFAQQPEAVRAEIRSADALCNPYLAFAALVHAGRKGLENSTSLQFVTDNLYQVDSTILKEMNIERLPVNFENALELYENSTFMQEFLGKTLFTNYLHYKKEELQSYNTMISEWELLRYLGK